MRWGLTCWHYFYLKSEIEAVVLRQSPALASLSPPFAKGGKRLRRLWGPAPQGPSPVPPAGGLAPLKRGSAKRWGLTGRHYFCLKAQIEADFLRQSPALASLSPPFAKGGKRLRRLCAPAAGAERGRPAPCVAAEPTRRVSGGSPPAGAAVPPGGRPWGSYYGGSGCPRRRRPGPRTTDCRSSGAGRCA